MIEVHFKNIRSRILKELYNAKHSISVAVYWFTNHELLDALKYKAKKGLKVTLIIHNDYINNRETGLDFQSLIESGGSFYFSDDYNPMHNKFCIIDEKVLINGSYNWTYYAETRNRENIIIIKRRKNIIKAFHEEFERIISLSEKIDKIVQLTKFEINDTKMLGTRNYLAHEILFQAKSQGRIEIADRAFEIEPSNIEIQKLACELNLKKRLKLKHSIGASLKNDGYLTVVPIGSIIPYFNTSTLRTSEDNQISCTSTISYGENTIASKNYKIDSLTVRGLPPKPAGESELRIITTIDLFGELKLEMVSIDTGNRANFSRKINSILEYI